MSTILNNHCVMFFQVFMSFGRQGATRAILQTCSLILLLGYWRLYHLGLGCTECKGELTLRYQHHCIASSVVHKLLYCVNFNRDIPMPLVTSGVEHGNLRELALARMRDLGTQCRDVRTREVGIQEIHHKVKPYEVTNCSIIL